MDIKASNILLGFGKGGDDQVFLLDFGLACHYNTKDFKPDPKKMHNGTSEYTSRDAHQGVPTIRGDIEILAYNLIEWAGAKLPWVVKNILTKPLEVQKAKEEFMKSTEKSVKSCFASASVPAQLLTFFKYVESMKHDTKPDYAKIRAMFEAGMKENSVKNSGPLEFAAKKTTMAAPAVAAKKKTVAKPNFKSQVVEPEIPKAGPSKRAPVAKRNQELKQYVEESESDDDIFVKSKKTKPAPAKKASKADKQPEPVPEEESRPLKRNRERPKYVIESEESEEEDYVARVKSPIKKSRAQPSPNSSTSKENQESPERVSPPQKKSKKDKEKSSKQDGEKSKSAAGSITLKSSSKSGKNKKTIQLNFNLDVSLDSDLVVVVNRKDKKKKEKNDEAEEASEHDVSLSNAGVYKGKLAKNR
jgi:vaccinia related kinase